MSHFSVCVLVPNDKQDVEQYVRDAMAPFDENAVVDPYVCYTLEKAAQEREKALSMLETALAENDPEKWNLEACKSEKERISAMTAEDIYNEYCEKHRVLRREFNEEGKPISTHNPNSKWDYFSIGGRWSGWLTDNEEANDSLEHNSIPVAVAIEKEKIPFAVVTPDGEWHGRGRMGWFGIVRDEKNPSDWKSEVLELYKKHPECTAVCVDCHV